MSNKLYKLHISIIIAALVLSGCGGGGGGDSSGGSGSVASTIMLSGTATFDRVPITSSGLNYAGTIPRAIRRAIVQVRDNTGATVLYQSQTDNSGGFAIPAPSSSNILILVLSELGTPSNIDTRVVNNLSSDALYAIYATKATGTSNEFGITLHAPSGWNGSAYGANRSSAPFAIMDTIIDAQDLIRSANSTIIFPQMDIGWCADNTSSYLTPATGRVTISGKENVDTDEFDTHIVAHEWGHWFEATFARSDSLGGNHVAGAGDILDETVAFGEGWGNAFSGMVNRNPSYIDSIGPQQGSTGTVMALESNSVPNTDLVGGGDPRRLDGGWSEASVQELLWDCYDGGSEMADTDGDGVNLGFAPLYAVLVGNQKTTPGFTSVYSFMHYLKNQNPSSTGAITTLESAENIGAHDAYQQPAVGMARYTQIPNDGTPLTLDIDGDPLTTYDSYGGITLSSPGNKLYNRLLFYAVAPSGGTFRIRVVPTDSTHDVVLYRGGGATPARSDTVFGGSEYLDLTASAGQTLTFAVGSLATATNPSGVTPFTVRFGTTAQVGKPTATVNDGPDLPNGDG